MELEEAKQVIYYEPEAPFGRLFFASGILTQPENDSQTSLADFLKCLERSTTLPGRINTVTEFAVLGLYRKSKRKRESRVPYEDFITDIQDWKKYLQENKLI